MSLRVAFHTLGCRSNFADTMELQAACVERGAIPCEFESTADVYVLNTCTVTDSADREVEKLVTKLKQRVGAPRLVITGCLAEVGAEQLTALGGVDAVIGPGRKHEIVQAIFAAAADDEATLQRRSDPSMLPNGAHQSSECGGNFVPLTDLGGARIRRSKKRSAERKSISLSEPLSLAVDGPGERIGELRNRARFHLRIQEGCENSCTFCIIPHSRGGLSSRPIEQVISDLLQLNQLGYNEVVLTGTHLGGYGEDTGSSLRELLQAIASSLQQLPTRPRIRLSSLDPNDVTAEIIDIIAGANTVPGPKNGFKSFDLGNIFCKHLHICVQSFSDPVLKRMNRRYRLSDIVELIQYAAQRMPGCGLGSDLIVGFPGESRADVDQAIETFLGLPFSYLHIFPYSERSGTPATELDGIVELGERKRRSARWRAIAAHRSRAFADGFIGKEVEMIVESAADTKKTSNSSAPIYFGVTDEFVRVKVSGANSQTDLIPGSRVIVRGVSFDESDEALFCSAVAAN